MQSSNQPGKISLPFASSGAKQPIPVASQVGVEDGRASYTDGFPPLTRTPLAAGGKPPFGTDMNGILNAVTAIQQWQSAGGMFTYDAALSTAIGGYPKGALLLKADASGYWQSTAENNTTNPDTGGAGWISSGPRGVVVFTVSGTFTVPPGVNTLWVSGCGGGGGGGFSSNITANVSGGGGGGGAGQPIIKNQYTVTPGQVIAVTIGTGGGSGTNGGSTIIGSLGTLSGGNGGAPGSNGVAGTAFGGIGGPGFPKGTDGTDASNSAGSGNGGTGANGPFGGGGGGSRSTFGGVPLVGAGANGYGAGGGGAGGQSNPSTKTGALGGIGAPGLVIFEW